MARPERAEAPSIAGARVLVTRPSGQAEALCRAIERAGGEPLRFPVMAIAGPADPALARAAVAGAGDHDLAIFVSANAVRACATLARELDTPPDWPPRVAVGPATARELEACGLGPVIAPGERFDSEGVLGLDALSAAVLAGRPVMIFRGEGGRDLLARELRRRGARVSEAALYRRELPAVDPAPVIAALERGALDAVVVTSGDGLRNLFALLGADAARRLQGATLVVVSRRVADLAGRLGLRREPVVAGAADERAIVAAIARDRGR